ncbi:MAG TPA: hypothetical protein VD930_01680, partial [Gemmatimonadales bacterium]|nr:hypothetical protein [Gemmatimonadales bacterium]
ALASFAPRRVVQRLDPNRLGDTALPAALQGMVSAGQTPRGYACTGTSCSQPAADVDSWRATLESLRSLVPV